MFQVLQYLSGQTTSGDDDQPVFTLSEPLSKGSAVFQEEFRGQKVALKVIDKRRPEQLLSKLLSLNDSSVVRYLECITVDQPVPRSLVIMELCQLSLATYLNGPMGDVRLEATDFAWQVTSGLDYLHSNQLMASLDPKNVLLAQEYGRHVVKLQVASDFDEYSVTAEREAGELFAVAELACLVFDSPNSDPVAEDSAMLFQHFVDHLQHPQPSKRPGSIRLIIYHPLFVLNRKDARHRLVNLTKNGAKFVNLINMEELDKWDVDIDDELRQVFGDEDIAHLCTLTEQYLEDQDFVCFLKQGRRQVPCHVTFFVYHLLAPCDVGAATLPSSAPRPDQPKEDEPVQPEEPAAEPPKPDEPEEPAPEPPKPEEPAPEPSKPEEPPTEPIPEGIQPVDDGSGIKLLQLIRTIDFEQLKCLSSDLSQVEPDGRTILHLAAQFNPLAAISRFLVDRGMNLKLADKAGRHPLHLAAGNNNAEVVAILIHCGADVNVVDSQGRTPLHLAAASNTNADVIQRLLEAGADPQAVDYEGNNPLRLARENANKEEIIDLLKPYEDQVDCFGLPALADDVIRRLTGCLPCNFL